MKKIFLLLAALYVPAAGAAYKCVDEKGLTHIGDTEPAACANVMLYEVSRSGTIIRSIEPTPTPEQVKVKRDEAERRKEAERVAAEQKRKDLALLSSYSDEREFEVARDRNIEPLAGRIKISKDRIKTIDARVAQLEDEMEYYKAGKSKASKTREPPQPLLHELQRLRIEKEGLEQSVAGTERQIEAFRVRFDIDKKRWLALKADPSARSTERK